MRTASANRMMEAILSNDDEDWHSHFDRGVKEASLDWYSRYIGNGGARSGDRGSATRYRSIAETPAGRGSTGNGRRGARVVLAVWTGSNRLARIRHCALSSSFYARMRVFVP
jgi:hypothetical protein